MSASVYDSVIGQERVVDLLRALADSPAHAYLFVGPPGCGKETAARAFAAVKLQGSEDADERVARLVMRGEHVDVHEIEREGASISLEQAREELVDVTGMSSVESGRRVTIMHELHLLAPFATAALLKTIEEPDAQNVIILLTDEVPAHLITIESRCVRLDFSAIPDRLVADTLVGEGVMPALAESVAEMVAGDLARARILVDDHGLAERMNMFSMVPRRLDGTAATALELTATIRAAIDEALEPYKRVHAREIADLEERERTLGLRGAGRRRILERHKREIRRSETDEIRSGLRIMSRVYAKALRDATEKTAHHQMDGYIQAISRIREANVSLGRNVNENLLLQTLFMSLPHIHD